MKTKILISVILLSLIGIGFTSWHLQTRHDENHNTTRTIEYAPSSEDTEEKTIYRFNSLAEYEKVSKYGKMPAVFKGRNYFTDLADADGNLIINSNILMLFKYFFLGLDEEGFENVTGRIKEYLRLTLQDKAANRALAIFEDYLDFREAMIEWKASYDSTMDKLAIFDELKALRRKYFSPEVADAFFSEEEAEIYYALKNRKIESDDSLNDEQKEDMFTELEQQLPEHEREQIRRQRKEKELNIKIKELQNQGASAEEIFQLRKDFYGEEVAKRMTFLNDFSDQWKNRVDKYNRAVEEINANPHFTDEEKEELVNETTKNTFTKEEIAKLVYYNMKQKN